MLYRLIIVLIDPVLLLVGDCEDTVSSLQRLRCLYNAYGPLNAEGGGIIFARQEDESRHSLHRETLSILTEQEPS